LIILVRDKLNIAHFAWSVSSFSDYSFKTTFGKFTGGKKGFAEITGDESAVIEFGFGDFLSVQIDPLEFLGEYVHGVGDFGHNSKVSSNTYAKFFIQMSQKHNFLILYLSQ
jgi:hypothetical protein